MSVTTGLYNSVPLTLNGLIGISLKKLRVYGAGDTVQASDFTDCTVIVQAMLREFAIEGLLLWCYDTIQVPMVGNQISYTIGPTGNVVTYRPLRVLEGTYIRVVIGGVPNDTPLIMMSRMDYEQQTAKTSASVPNSYYYDAQMGLGSYDPTQGNGVLYVWTAPSDGTRTVFCQVQRPIQDVANATDTFDLPLEWYNALIKTTMMELLDMYEIPEDRAERVIRSGEAAKKKIADWGATEQAPIRFQPDYTVMM